MSYRIVKGSITDIAADAIVNASNGVGYMGGLLGRFVQLKGVAESIHYATKGIVEKEAKKVVKSGVGEGTVFTTSAGNLQASFIIHAVTMDKPGQRANISTIKGLLPKILSKAYELQVKSIVLPLLGTGTGRLSKEEVLALYEEFFKDITDLDIILCTY